MKKNKKTCCLTSALSKISSVNYKEKCKYLILIPVLLIAFAIMLTSIFGLNLQSDIQNRYEFVVDFGIEIEAEKQNEYEDKIADALEKNELAVIKYTKYGQSDIYTGLMVTIDPSVSDLSDDKLEEIRESLEAELQASITNTVEVTDIELVRLDMTGTIVKALIAMVVTILAIFVYVWIRFNISTAVASIILGLISPAMIFVAYGLFRLPFGMSGFAIMFIGMILAEGIFIYIADHIRAKELDDIAMTNNEYVTNANKAVLNTVSMPIIGLAALFLLGTIVMLFININIAFTLMSVIFALLVTMYSAMYVGTSFWTIIYKKDKDQRLRNRIERQSKIKEKRRKTSDKDSNDKIVV